MSIGIDFGTCWSSAGVRSGAEILLVKEPVGQGYSFPSSAFWDEQEGRLLIGERAELARAGNPLAYIREWKRSIGKGETHPLGRRSFSTEDLVAAFLGELADHSASLMADGNRPVSAVIAVPATYTTHRLDCMKAAAERARLTATLIEEPIAAALAHGHARGETFAEGEPILVYDLGGGTFDVALLARRKGQLVAIGPPVGLDEHGGIDFDRAILADLLDQLGPGLREAIRNLSDRQAQEVRFELWGHCRSIKHQLSCGKQAWARITASGSTQEYRLERGRFESLIQPMIAATVRVCREVLADAGFGKDSCPRILLNGGSTRIPSIRSALAREFGREPETIHDPELAVCQGATLVAGTTATRTVVLLPDRPYRVKRDPFR